MARFMSLPLELREKVYKYVLFDAIQSRRDRRAPFLDHAPATHFENIPCCEIFNGSSCCQHKPRRYLKGSGIATQLVLLLLSRSINEEATYVLATRFCFRLDECNARRFLDNASPALVRQIRHIVVRTVLCPYLEKCFQEGKLVGHSFLREYLAYLRKSLPRLRTVCIPKSPDWHDEADLDAPIHIWAEQLLLFKGVEQLKIVPFKPSDESDVFEKINAMLKKELQDLNESEDSSLNPVSERLQAMSISSGKNVE